MKEKVTRDIHDRIYKFVIRVLKLIKQLPKTPENLIIIGQIARSATSMGANDQEANGVTTKKTSSTNIALFVKKAKKLFIGLTLLLTQMKF